MPRFLAPITVAQEYVTENETITGNETILGVTSGKASHWDSVSVVSGISADHVIVNSRLEIGSGTTILYVGDNSIGINTETPLHTLDVDGSINASGNVTSSNSITANIGVFNTSLSSSSLSGVFYGDGSNLTNLNAENISSGIISNSRLPAFNGDIVTTTGSSSASVVKLQGYTISTATPSIGQMLQWNGNAWVPASIPTGGSGGGGISYYLNYGTIADSPTTGLPSNSNTKELGRTSNTPLTSITSAVLSEVDYDLVCGFVSDLLDPSITTIPAGLWDFNIWASSNANQSNQTILKVVVYTYDGSTATPIASSDDVSIYDPIVIAQYIANVTIPQTTISSSNRIYVELRGKATSNNKTITLSFGGNTPAHVHTTIPSVAGSGLVKTVNGVFQTPASLLVDVDVADNAQISQNKISGLSASLASKFNTTDVIPISSGGTGASNASGALAALGGFPISGGTITDGLTASSGTFTTYLSSSSISGTFYGDGNNLTNLNTSNISGNIPISKGGTNVSTIGDARTSFGGIQPVLIRHNSVVNLLSAGSLTGASWTSGSPTVTFTSSSIPLVAGMSIQATGLTTAVIKTVDSPTQVTMSSNATASSTGSVTVYGSSTTGLTASTGVITMDGKTLSVGDVILLTAQTASAQNGPWVVQTVGAVGVSMVLSRPSWFTGTLNGPMLFGTQQGLNNSGYVICVTGSLSAANATIGIDSLASNTVSQRATLAVLSNAQTFTQRQTFAAGTATVNPISFQNGILLTTPTAHAMEWDGTSLYTTTSGSVRTQQAAFTTVPTVSTSAGLSGQIAFDSNFLYVCTATNTWKRVQLNAW